MNSLSSDIFSIKKSLKKLKPFVENLKQKRTIHERLSILNTLPNVKNYLKNAPHLKKFILSCNHLDQFILTSLMAIGQGPLIFQGLKKFSLLKKLLPQLSAVEKFYDGGIIGYHILMLQLILEKESGGIHENVSKEQNKYLKPPGYDLSKNTLFVRKAVKEYLKNMHMIAEIYPVGGAGDRLNLHDEKTGEALPSAELLFEGRTLIEGLIRDLQAREYLYYKLFKKQIVVPIAMMTSDEKNNHKHIISICEGLKWFGRARESFDFFKQPLVPVLTENGNWALSEPMKICFKPGGHGVLWKLALDSGVIDRLMEKGFTKTLVRQINNPIAGTDNGLLAFCGSGILNKQLFGFASCPRLLNTAEGMNVLVEKKENGCFEYGISNIEYPDFIKKHIKDVAEHPGSPFSAFPANTNILFADLQAIKEAVRKCPVPGILINMKNKHLCLSSKGKKEDVMTGRLESLMQNIADVITNRFSQPKKHLKPDSLHTYLTYNKRRKTISVTKKLHVEGQPIVETPEGCYYDRLLNHHELFSKHCKMKLPKMPSESDYLKKGPNFIIEYHPALGPLYSIIAQKIQGGRLEKGAEMRLEIAEIEMNHVDVHGSLLIQAENILGNKDRKGIIQYSEKTGRCLLNNVKIVNKGIDQRQTLSYWKGEILRLEALKIKLQGHSEFVAEGVTFEGNFAIEVPDGCRMTAHQQKGRIEFKIERLISPKSWKYSFGEDDEILIEKRRQSRRNPK
jgi:UTP---glucose-1-phosphate uridylyltransferase